MFVDFVLNGQAHGQVGAGLAEVRFDSDLLRPFVDNRGNRCVMMKTGRFKEEKVVQNGRSATVLLPEKRKVLISALQAKGINHPVYNASLLPKDAWIRMDQRLIELSRQRLRAWADLYAANPYSGFDGMGVMTIEQQRVSDAGEAVVDMDGMTDGRTDRPLFDLASIPLPITHSDFWFSEREIATSRNTGRPLPSLMSDRAMRRVAETVEQTTIGTVTGMSFGTRATGDNAHTGTSQVYGYTNYPYRITKTDLVAPTGSNPDAIMTDVLEMIELANANGFFGPFILYTSTGYTRYINDDYFRSGSTSAVRSVRQRILEIEGILDVRRLDYLTSGYQLLLVQMTSDVAQGINGMPMRVVQWDSQGGLRKNFKVMCIYVPWMHSNYGGVTGIVHGTTA